MKPLKIFLCHASGDKAEAKQLYTLLNGYGAQPWMDSEDILPGQEWNMEIRKNLDAADAILLCLTKKSVDKEGYVQKEIRLALDRAREMPEGRVFLIPVKLEKCDVPYSLKEYQWVELFVEDGMERLIKALNARAAQIKAQALSGGGAAPKVKKSTPVRRAGSKPASPNTTINIYGNMTDSNLVVGRDNEVENNSKES